MPLQSRKIPVATEVAEKDEYVPVATAILDWDILARRMDPHLDIAVFIVRVGLRHAREEQIRADLKATFGFMFNSKDMREAAAQDRRRVDEIRAGTLKFAAGYLVVSFAANFAYWLVEQGVVKQARDFAKEVVTEVSNVFSVGLSWLKRQIVTTKPRIENTLQPSAPYLSQSEIMAKLVQPSAPPAAVVFRTAEAPDKYPETVVVAEQAISPVAYPRVW